MYDFDFDEAIREGDLVDDVALKLNLPEYFADVGKYDKAKLESEIRRMVTRIRGCTGVFDTLEPYYKEYLLKLRNEHDKRIKSG